MAFETKIAVRGYHCDAYGHVNNARYLELFEEARWRALEESGALASIAQMNLLFFVVNLNVSFKKPVEIGDITIRTSMTETGRKTVAFKQELYAGGELSTEMIVKFVLFNPATNRAETISEEVVQLFSKFK